MKISKRSARIVSILCALILAFSVWGPKEAQAGSMTLKDGVKSKYIAVSKGEKITVTLTGALSTAKVLKKPDWITASKNGRNFTLTVRAIPTGTSGRSEDITFYEGTKLWILTVAQYCSHTYAWETTRAATCTVDGMQVYRCTKCKQLSNGNNNYRTITAKHTFITGSNNERYCKVCNTPDYDYYINASTHYISTSGSDERKQAKGGEAGDSTGEEWKMTTSFSSINVSPSNTQKNIKINVYRYTANSEVGKKLARLSIEAALNNNIGYDQDERTTYMTELKKVGWDPKKITNKCEQDCAAGVSSNVIAVGNLLNLPKLRDMPISATGAIGDSLTNAGYTKVYSDKSSLSTSEINSLKAGDILVVRYQKKNDKGDWEWKGHAVVNVTGN